MHRAGKNTNGAGTGKRGSVDVKMIERVTAAGKQPSGEAIEKSL